MEADYTEVELTHIPKALHRIIVGVKGATVKALRKEFKVEVEVPDDRSKATTIAVSGPKAGVNKCVAKIDHLIATEGSVSSSAASASTTAAVSTTNKPAPNAINDNEKPKKSAKVVTTGPDSNTPNTVPPNAQPSFHFITISFDFEKAAHAKLKGPKDAKKEELQGVLRAEVEKAVRACSACKVSAVFPPSGDLQSTRITISIDADTKGGTSSSSVDAASITASLTDAIKGFLSTHKLSNHLRGGGIDVTVRADNLREATTATATASAGGRAAHTNNKASRTTSTTTSTDTADKKSASSAMGSRSQTDASNTTDANDRDGANDGGSKGAKKPSRRGRRGNKNKGGERDGDGVEEDGTAAKRSVPAGREEEKSKTLPSPAAASTNATAAKTSSAAAKNTSTKLYRQPQNPFTATTTPPNMDPFAILGDAINPGAPRRAVFA